MAKSAVSLTPTREDFEALLAESFGDNPASRRLGRQGPRRRHRERLRHHRCRPQDRRPHRAQGILPARQGHRDQGRATRSRSISSASRTRWAKPCCRATRRAARKPGPASSSPHAKNERVDGVIFGRVKGGFTVDLGGAVAFLPGSQVDIRPIRDVGAADERHPALPDPQDGPPPRQYRRVAPRHHGRDPRRAALRTRPEPRRRPGGRRRGQEHHRLRRVRRSGRHRRPAACHRHRLEARQPSLRRAVGRPDA